MAKKTTSMKAAVEAAAKQLPKPYTGTDPTANAPAPADAGVDRGNRERDRAEIDYRLGMGSYDRISAGGTSQPPHYQGS
jgi:hypothetical protein